MNYVCGFAFNMERTHVLLILKDHPEWQRDKLNGVGGKIEDCESPVHAMVREFNEEIGIKTVESDWLPLIKLNGIEQDGSEWVVFFYKTMVDIDQARRKETEKPYILPVNAIFDYFNIVPNLKWLIPMCLSDDAKSFFVR